MQFFSLRPGVLALIWDLFVPLRQHLLWQRRIMVKGLLLKWLVNAMALFVVVNVVAGISVERWQTLLVGALALGLLNAFFRPILLLLTLPINVLTLGLFTLIINGLIFYLAAWMIKGFYVAGFWSAFVAALVFSIVSFLLNLLIRPD
jgi:putative membrane protein